MILCTAGRNCRNFIFSIIESHVWFAHILFSYSHFILLQRVAALSNMEADSHDTTSPPDNRKTILYPCPSCKLYFSRLATHYALCEQRSHKGENEDDNGTMTRLGRAFKSVRTTTISRQKS
jgi:hypothetical protein